jgi:CRISPR/Cas system endoribonuclease Cas6 (RAMP superfamily)
VLVYTLGIDTLRYADPSEHVEFQWPLTPVQIPGVTPTVRRRGFTDDPVELDVLESLANASGGKAWLVSETWTNGNGEVDEVLDEVAAELRSQYTLGYYPTSARDGRLHEIRVTVGNADYTVRTRAATRARTETGGPDYLGRGTPG